MLYAIISIILFFFILQLILGRGLRPYTAYKLGSSLRSAVAAWGIIERDLLAGRRGVKRTPAATGYELPIQTSILAIGSLALALVVGWMTAPYQLVYFAAAAVFGYMMLMSSLLGNTRGYGPFDRINLMLILPFLPWMSLAYWVVWNRSKHPLAQK